MNVQERELLTAFLQQLSGAQAGQKDAEADALIREACVRQPDAAYLLVQRAMQLGQALQATQAQAGQLQAELDQLRAGTKSSFLADANAWGKSVVASPQVPAAMSHSAPLAPLAPLAQPRAAAMAPAAAATPAWGSSMLGTVATTAAGVVAGSFLYHGIENLMGNHNQGSALGANSAHATPATENTVINNYYGDSGNDAGGNDTELADAGSSFDDSGDNT